MTTSQSVRLERNLNFRLPCLRKYYVLLCCLLMWIPSYVHCSGGSLDQAAFWVPLKLSAIEQDDANMELTSPLHCSSPTPSSSSGQSHQTREEEERQQHRAAGIPGEGRQEVLAAQQGPE
ncbi:uncharacterized protein LOC125878876 isoform X3 [Epinephelus fuscoguttatus]|uniref:uncharacterized protein LOC125878876 isoform X3 n=1 Tax=Epinephelus fuscoguttatus TaxID=293821 RepID=UPI0020D033AC|nr:uncharacterized protein LOC125878876 isoform X3 [Epinephelus fuscoguttatus]